MIGKLCVLNLQPNCKKMNNNEKIHQILEYVSTKSNQGSFDTEQISEAVNISLEETNILVRQLIANGDAKRYDTKEMGENSIGLIRTVETKDAYNTKKYLKRSEMKYNIYIIADKYSFSLMNLSERKLDIVVNAYKKGKTNMTISGEKWWIKGLQTIKIFAYEKNIGLEKFYEYCERERVTQKTKWGDFYAPKELELLGRDVTDDIIGDHEYGEQSLTEEAPKQNSDFINSKRLNELKGINHPDLDLIKLIRLCEEINDNFSRRNYLAVGMIGRTILNHIPPIFGFDNFNQITANYGGPKNNKSFKKNMEHLNNSLKNIADRYLHQTMRDKETLPNVTQIDFRQDLDVLLEEIVRILKR